MPNVLTGKEANKAHCEAIVEERKAEYDPSLPTYEDALADLLTFEPKTKAPTVASVVSGNDRKKKEWIDYASGQSFRVEITCVGISELVLPEIKEALGPDADIPPDSAHIYVCVSGHTPMRWVDDWKPALEAWLVSRSLHATSILMRGRK